MSVPPRKYDPKLEVLWRDTSSRPHAPADSPVWRIGTIANGRPKSPFFCQKEDTWLYPVIVERPNGPRILQWVREDDISGARQPPIQVGARSKTVL